MQRLFLQLRNGRLVIHIQDRYYAYVANNLGVQPKAAVNMIWSRTLDPDSPAYKWEEGWCQCSGHTFFAMEGWLARRWREPQGKHL